MTTYQVRDPLTDNPEDGWTAIPAMSAHKAAQEFRIVRNIPILRPVLVTNGNGKSWTFPDPDEPPPPKRVKPKQPPKPIGRPRGFGQMPKDTATILREVAARPGMTGDEILAEVFGPDALPLFKEMLAFRGTLFSLKREGRLANEDGRYSLPSSGPNAALTGGRS